MFDVLSVTSDDDDDENNSDSSASNEDDEMEPVELVSDLASDSDQESIAEAEDAASDGNLSAAEGDANSTESSWETTSE